MVNKKFCRLSEKERYAKFTTILQRKTGGKLLKKEIDEIINLIVPNQQYHIGVYRDKVVFHENIKYFINKGYRIYKKIEISGSDNVSYHGKKLVILERNTSRGSGDYQLHILIP